MLRIAKSFFTILAVAAVAVGATGAYFSDTETVAGNSFSSGTLDLKVDNMDNPTTIATFGEMYPGQTARPSWILKNTGTIAGQPSVTFGPVVNDDNNCIDPESSEDTTCGPTGGGELGAAMYVQAHWRQGAGAWQAIRLHNGWGDTKLNNIAGTTAGLGLNNAITTDNPLPVLNQGDEVEFRLTGWLMNSVGNIIQSDSAMFDITFNLDQ